MLSDPWSFLLLREAHLGRRTFAEFRESLGIATDVLSARLAVLVEYGILERTPYQQPGQRTRDAYTLTRAGEDLKVVLVALQQWGNVHLPSEKPARIVTRTRDTGENVRAMLVVEATGEAVDTERVEFTHVLEDGE